MENVKSEIDGREVKVFDQNRSTGFRENSKENSSNREKYILAGMFLFYLLWVLIKTFFGNPDHKDTASQLLVWTVPATLLFFSLWYLIPGLNKSRFLFGITIQQLSQKQRRWGWIGLLIPALVIDLFFAASFGLDIADEGAFIRCVQRFTETGAAGFFDHYEDLPWIGRQHPPFHILVVSFVVNLFSGDILFTARGIAILLGLGTLGMTYLIARQLYNRQVALLAVVLLFSMRYFFLFHIVSTNDIYIVFFLSLTIWSLLRLNALGDRINRATFGWAALAGLSISLGVLNKYTMVLAYGILPGLFLWPFFNRFNRQYQLQQPYLNIKRGLLIATLVFLVSVPLIAIWVNYLFESDLYRYHLSRIAGYLGTEIGIEQDEIKINEVEYFTFWRLKFKAKALIYAIPAAIGMHLLPLLGLGIWAWWQKMGTYREQWSTRFLGYWIAIIFIPIFLTLPVNRYFLPAFPALAILMAYGVHCYIKNPVRILVVAILLTLCSVLVYLA